MDIIIPIAAQLDIWRVREAAARVLKTASPSARIHDEWKLGFDLAQSVSVLTVRESDVAPEDQEYVGQVYCWMLGVDDVHVVVNGNGDIPEIGGNSYELEVTFPLWGFVQDTLVRPGDGIGGHRFTEVEMEKVIAFFMSNHRLGLDQPHVESLRRVTAPKFAPIDVHNFTEGVDVYVPQGSFTVLIERVLQ